MIQEEKDLLLKDLCARLPYGVIAAYKSQGSEGRVKLGYGNIGYVSEIGRGWWIYCKPYLRPMSCMTKDEQDEYLDLIIPVDGGKGVIEEEKFSKVQEFYNSHHLDYNSLIPKGLALEAPEGMYNKKEGNT